MAADTILISIIAHERLVTHDANPSAGICQHVLVFQLRSASWLLVLEVKLTKCGRVLEEQSRWMARNSQ